MLYKLTLLIQTVSHLKWIQVCYQVYYKFRNKVFKAQAFASLKGYKPTKKILFLKRNDFVPDASGLVLAKGCHEFKFLNLSHRFSGTDIDWNFEEKGKLWNYNLNYFDFLHDQSLKKEEGLDLISKYCNSFDKLDGGLEPYPISLRGINWIKYLSKNNVKDKRIDECLFKQYIILSASLEFHILANHLLENAFSLLFGAYYFGNEVFYRKAEELLRTQLGEQVLEDGAHFERSPMYHQIILFKLLDIVNLVKNNSWKSHNSLEFYTDYASKMLRWLEGISFENGAIPMVKDATTGIAPSCKQLFDYASKLNLQWNDGASSLNFSGYRKFKTSRMEMLMDVGEITPSYQPGHAHADEFNFILYVDGKPMIVDTGISTYEKNERRQLERSTSSHNCICIDNQSSSKVWGGFRVAQRAKVNLLIDSPMAVTATHNGFSKQGVSVTREFELIDQTISIRDKIKCDSSTLEKAKLNLHFHPDVKIELVNNEVFIDNLHIILTGFDRITIENYMFACGFNELREAQRISLKISQETRILISNVN
jgi:Heparinase II/III-like protein/Heparinase II/III N-terminus